MTNQRDFPGTQYVSAYRGQDRKAGLDAFRHGDRGPV